MKFCDICGKEFAQISGRQKMCDEHLKMKKVNCNRCGLQFVVKLGNKRKTCYSCKAEPKKCENCGKVFNPNPNAKRIAAYCSEKCRHHARYVRTYVRKGYNQKGPNNNHWVSGKSKYYQNIAFATYGKVCNRCGSTRFLCVHHKDRNRNNNNISNLEVLCRSCHAKEHGLYQNFA